MQYIIKKRIINSVTSIGRAVCTITLLGTLLLSGCPQSHSPAGKDTPPQPNKSILEQAEEQLHITYAPKDNKDTVTQDIILPTALAGLNSVTVSWKSSNPAVITDAGKVFRPAQEDTPVTLTATLKETTAAGTESKEKTFTVTVKAVPMATTPEEMVTFAAENLKIRFNGNDTADAVTQNIPLPSESPQYSEVTITWSSNEPSVISSGGTVTRKADSSTPVKLTATLEKDTVKKEKIFNVTVLQSDEGMVTQAHAALNITYAQGDTDTSVTQNLTLPTALAGFSGVTVSWKSSIPAVITDEGAVTRPPAGNTQVTLTATLKKNEAAQEKTFTVTVLQSDEGAVSKAANALVIDSVLEDGKATVKQDLTLPEKLNSFQDVSITWKSDKPNVITNNGLVYRSDTDVPVTLTATLKKNTATKTKTFNLIVKKVKKLEKTSNAQEAVDFAKDALRIGFTGTNDTKDRVTAKLELPAESPQYNEVTITWSSSNASVIANDGTVTRQQDDTSVTLTATLSKNGKTASREFTVMVLGTAEEQLKIALENFTPAWASEITSHITLESSLTALPDSQLSWTSSNSAVVNPADGTVIPDLIDTPVTLTASAEYRGKTAQKTFQCTVKRILKLTSIINNGNSGSDHRRYVYDFTAEGELITSFLEGQPGSETSRDGTKYTLTQNPAEKQFTLTKKATKSSPNGNVWQDIATPIETAKKQRIELFKYSFGTKFHALKADPSWSNFKQYRIEQIKIEEPHSTIGTEDEAVFKKVKQTYSFGLIDFLKGLDTWQKFNALTEEQQKEAIAKGIEELKKRIYTMAQLTENATLEEAVAKVIKNEEQQYNQNIQAETEPVTYSYKVLAQKNNTAEYPEGWRLEAFAVYNAEKLWFTQRGNYENEEKTIQLEFQGPPINAPSRYGNLSIQINGETKIYSGSCTEKHYTGKTSNETAEVDIEPNNNGGITIIYQGKPYQLVFRGTKLE